MPVVYSRRPKPAPEPRIFGLPVELKVNVLALAAFTISLVSIGIAAYSAWRGPEDRLVASGANYALVGSDGIARIISTDVVVFNRAGSPYSDAILGYTLTVHASDGTIFCVKSTSVSNILERSDAHP